MAYTTLPAAHSEADAVLAQQVGRRLQLRELHVFWTLPTPKPRRRNASAPTGLTGAFASLGALLERIGDRLSAR